ncbi:MAG TPA: beta-N-acetylhexosaminidase [Rhizomicrobium sp.]|jgi:beta-N-acetylhexosaminidase|nr:beta-N-acetylhexosaminidase [Rhizomicrobium sp.]
MRTRAIYGCAGPVLSAQERRFFAEARPWGFILFARNVVDRPQLRELVASLREAAGDAAAPVLIDQEGGRVARLRPPGWSARPPAALFGALHARDPDAAREAVHLNTRLIAFDLAEAGINANCIPVLDVPVEGSDAIIGDRAFSRDPAVVADLGASAVEASLKGGVLPVMKHIPGHGRASADSHLALPHVDAGAEALGATDFRTFHALRRCPMAMTAHVVYDAIDPLNPATTSAAVIRDVIRTQIGFDGLLMSDDLSMNALSGPISGRARAALFAGCDVVLHCNGKMEEMREVAEEAKPLDGLPLERARKALAHLREPEPFDPRAAAARLAELAGLPA